MEVSGVLEGQRARPTCCWNSVSERREVADEVRREISSQIIRGFVGSQLLGAEDKAAGKL